MDISTAGRVQIEKKLQNTKYQAKLRDGLKMEGQHLCPAAHGCRAVHYGESCGLNVRFVDVHVGKSVRADKNWMQYEISTQWGTAVTRLGPPLGEVHSNYNSI